MLKLGPEQALARACLSATGLLAACTGFVVCKADAVFCCLRQVNCGHTRHACQVCSACWLMCEGCYCGVELYVLDAPSYVAGVDTVCSVQHAPQRLYAIARQPICHKESAADQQCLMQKQCSASVRANAVWYILVV